MYRFQKQTKKSSAVQRTIQQCTATNILLIFFIQQSTIILSHRSTTLPSPHVTPPYYLPYTPYYLP